MRWATTPDEIRHHHDVTAMVTLNQINAIKRDDGSVFDVPLSFHPAATRVLGLVTPRSVG